MLRRRIFLFVSVCANSVAGSARASISMSAMIDAAAFWRLDVAAAASVVAAGAATGFAAAVVVFAALLL